MNDPKMNPTNALRHIHTRLGQEGLADVVVTLEDLMRPLESGSIRSAELLSTIWKLMDLHPEHKDQILAIAKEA